MSTKRMTVEAYPQQAPEFIKLLANDLRWSLLKALTVSDLQVNELVARFQQPMNLISYHLKKMRDDGLVSTRRSEADGRDIYYSLEPERLRQMYLAAGEELLPAIGLKNPPLEAVRLKHQRILFVCTHNSARSQMAEAVMRQVSHGQLDVFSAGSHPTAVHPSAIHTLKKFDLDISANSSRSLEDFAGQAFNFVITVCDKAREICPTFPGASTQIHWGFADPVAIQDDRQRAEMFERIALALQSRIRYFVSTLPTISAESES